jgi:hypothetical protein
MNRGIMMPLSEPHRPAAAQDSKSMIMSASLPQWVHFLVSFCFFLVTPASSTSTSSQVTIISASFPQFVQEQISFLATMDISPHMGDELE